MWDVVNEALNDDGSLRETLFLEMMGDDYIEKACDKVKYTRLLTNNSGKLENESLILKAEVGLLQSQV